MSVVSLAMETTVAQKQSVLRLGLEKRNPISAVKRRVGSMRIKEVFSEKVHTGKKSIT